MASSEDNAQGSAENFSLIVTSCDSDNGSEYHKSTGEFDKISIKSQSVCDEETQPLVDAMEKLESSSGEATPSDSSTEGEATSACDAASKMSSISPVVEISESHPLIAEDSAPSDTPPRSCLLDHVPSRPDESQTTSSKDTDGETGNAAPSATVIAGTDELKPSSVGVGVEQTDSGTVSSSNDIVSEDTGQLHSAETPSPHAQEQDEDCEGMSATEKLEWREFLDQRLEEAHRCSSSRFIAMTPPRKTRPGSRSEDGTRAEGGSGDDGSVYIFTPGGSKTKMSPFAKFKKNFMTRPKKTPSRSRRHLELPSDMDATKAIEDSFELKPLEVEQRPDENKSWRLSGFLSVSMSEENCCHCNHGSYLSRLAACLRSLCGRLAACFCCCDNNDKKTADDDVV